ncbi:MAG: DsbA family protein [Methylosarcina sp.]
MSDILFYVHDPMCSWCYAFQTALSGLEKNLPSSIRLKKLVGGLAPDTTSAMPLALQQSIQQTWRRIENTVPHVRFNYDFWTVNTPIRSTYPACRAVLAAKKQGSGREDKMIQAIQNAYYRQAKNPALQPVLMECAADIGLDLKKFEQDMKSLDLEKELQDQLSQARQLGVNTYPSLRLQQGARISSITVNYLNYQAMLEEIMQARMF